MKALIQRLGELTMTMTITITTTYYLTFFFTIMKKIDFTAIQLII